MKEEEKNWRNEGERRVVYRKCEGERKTRRKSWRKKGWKKEKKKERKKGKGLGRLLGAVGQEILLVEEYRLVLQLYPTQYIV